MKKLTDEEVKSNSRGVAQMEFKMSRRIGNSIEVKFSGAYEPAEKVESDRNALLALGFKQTDNYHTADFTLSCGNPDYPGYIDLMKKEIAVEWMEKCKAAGVILIYVPQIDGCMRVREVIEKSKEN